MQNPPQNPSSTDIAQIQRIDRGTINVIRQGPRGPCHNHQCYEKGRNVSRYVPQDQVTDLKQDIDGYHAFSNFKDSVQIVDFYHAMEHAVKVLDALIGKTHPDFKKRQRRWAKQLLKDKIQALITKHVRN